jgi:phosphatidylserine/phosphatidylglycerophosphate/cardiolipin synthase-like enzyme
VQRTSAMAVASLNRLRSAVAHSKVIIVDGELVVTGSFNFTKSEQERNAEKRTFIQSTPETWLAGFWQIARA